MRINRLINFFTIYFHVHIPLIQDYTIKISFYGVIFFFIGNYKG